jgi:hypothetical protein
LLQTYLEQAGFVREAAFSPRVFADSPLHVGRGNKGRCLGAGKVVSRGLNGGRCRFCGSKAIAELVEVAVKGV